MASPREVAAMRHAIALSAFGLGTTSPNPPVGCVILGADGRTVGAGFHQRKGEPHAETYALAAAGAAAAGGTAVVTLEPCNHVGVTPACRQALLDAGIRRVVISVIDPTSRGDGGAAVLTDAGVDVEVGLLAEETLTVLRPWLTATTMGRPYITWTFTAGPDTSAGQDRTVSQLRQRHDVIVLPTRVEEGIAEGHGKERFRLPHVAPSASGDPAEFLTDAFSGGARSLLLVGDTDLARTMLTQELVDQLVILAPRIEPGEAYKAAPADLLPAPGLSIASVTTTDQAIVVEARR